MADRQSPLSVPRQFPASSCYYICRSCYLIVGCHEHLVSPVLEIIPDCIFLTQVQPGNAFVERNRPFERGMYSLLSLKCGVCSSFLGWKIGGSVGPLSMIFVEGTFILFLRCIYFWNGLDLVVDPVWSQEA